MPVPNLACWSLPIKFMDNQDIKLDPQPDSESSPILQVPVSGTAEPSEPPAPVPVSPRWGSTTKLVVGLSLVLAIAFLFARFLNIVGPLLLAILLAYLFHPITLWLKKTTGVSWPVATTVVYLILLLLVLGSLGLGGLAVVEQVQSLINFLQTALKDLPTFFNNIASKPFQIGPFVFNLKLLDFNVIGQQILGAVQPVLTQAGASVVTVATKVGTVIGWLFFILLVSYFVLAESGGTSKRLINLSIPGFEDDIALLSTALGNIWNSFLRGQITIVLITIFFYNILLGGLQVHYFFGLSLLAGLARFIPYVGPLIAWTSYGLVAFFQGSTIFGLPPLGYVALVVGCAWLTDVVMDNVVVPRLMSNALRVHPAAVMVSALVAFNLLGMIGVVLAAPVLATVQLLLDYLVAKLSDRNPWVNLSREMNPPNQQSSILMAVKKIIDQIRVKFVKGSRRPKVFERK